MTKFYSVLAMMAMAASVGWASADDFCWAIQWKNACFVELSGEFLPELSGPSFCRGHKINRTSECISDIAGHPCAVLDGWCVSVPAPTTLDGMGLSAPTTPPNGVRCRAITVGEFSRQVSGEDPVELYRYACFDKTTGRLQQTTTPDGFCGTRPTTPPEAACTSYDCDVDAECVSVADGHTCSCVSRGIKNLTASDTAGQNCMHVTAAELAAIVRGWPLNL